MLVNRIVTLKRCSVTVSVCVSLTNSLSLSSITHCEKCCYMTDLYGNRYFDTMTQLLSCDRKTVFVKLTESGGLIREVGEGLV